MPDEFFAVHHDPSFVVFHRTGSESLGKHLSAVIVHSLIPHGVQVDQWQRFVVPWALGALGFVGEHRSNSSWVIDGELPGPCCC